MNITILILLALTVALAVAASFRLAHIELEEDDEDLGTFKRSVRFRPDRLGTAFAIGSVAFAAAAGTLSLWAPGFD
ncbi:hypothetical protein [Kocuria rosea]|uniref:Uncharacterized protein n=1 Tax=Kocuria rosea subsp. polaris TaxID=136273 RepID=A0A0A6VRN9_KOCRO|nr:hypothetical protein [Kocuria polaris]KHD96449.1 hypothetical protein GY22_15765 [Kocuria polaris]